jgi:hypothetical protein
VKALDKSYRPLVVVLPYAGARCSDSFRIVEYERRLGGYDLYLDFFILDPMRRFKDLT